MSRYLDESTADAWRGFQARLADHIHDMQDDDLLLIEVEEPTDVDSPDGVLAGRVSKRAAAERFSTCARHR
jgi:hypothetical protein